MKNTEAEAKKKKYLQTQIDLGDIWHLLISLVGGFKGVHGSKPNTAWIQALLGFTPKQLDHGVEQVISLHKSDFLSANQFRGYCGVRAAPCHKMFEKEPEVEVDPAPDGTPLIEHDDSTANKRKRAWAARDAALAEINPVLAKPYVNPSSRVARIKAKAKASMMAPQLKKLSDQIDDNEAARLAKLIAEKAPESQSKVESPPENVQSGSDPSTQPPASSESPELLI